VAYEREKLREKCKNKMEIPPPPSKETYNYRKIYHILKVTSSFSLFANVLKNNLF
jgi:hypothetical protein